MGSMTYTDLLSVSKFGGGKISVLLFLLCSGAYFSVGQTNLVPNPSFGFINLVLLVLDN